MYKSFDVHGLMLLMTCQISCPVDMLLLVVWCLIRCDGYRRGVLILNDHFHTLNWILSGVGDGQSGPHAVECIVPPACPAGCLCTDGIVDCRDKGLTAIPEDVPETVTELWVRNYKGFPFKGPYSNKRRRHHNGSGIMLACGTILRSLFLLVCCQVIKVHYL